MGQRKGCVHRESAVFDPEPTFPSPRPSGCASIIQPALKTERRMEMSNMPDGSTVSSLIRGEV
jgi:hypothetical protein